MRKRNYRGQRRNIVKEMYALAHATSFPDFWAAYLRFEAGYTDEGPK